MRAEYQRIHPIDYAWISGPVFQVPVAIAGNQPIMANAAIIGLASSEMCFIVEPEDVLDYLNKKD